MTTDLRATLAAADPARHDTYDDVGLRRRAGEILAEQQTAATGTVTTKTRRRLVVVTAVAAVLVGGVVAVPSLVGGVSRDHQQAAVLLDDAADAVGTTDPPARGDQYWQLTSSGSGLASIGRTDGFRQFLVTQAGTSYVAVDGSRPTVVVSEPSRVLRQLSGPPASGDELPAPTAPGVSTLPAPNDSPPNWQGPTPAFLAALPRDSGDLLARIRADSAGAGNSADGEVVVTVADVLRSGLVPADLRAALYRVLAEVPGVVVSAASVTVDGTDGVAFAYDEAADGIRQELVIDTDTGVLVGERQVATRDLDGIPAGTVIGQTTVTRTLVDAVPSEVTAGGRVFRCVTAADSTVTCSG